jgi:hypothetical protein
MKKPAEPNPVQPEALDATQAPPDTASVQDERDADGGARQLIAQRAYERFVTRGGEHGHDQEDWFEAERELTGGRRP